MENLISDSELNKIIHKTEFISCANYLDEDWTKIESCSFDRIVGVKHSVILRLRGQFTIEGSERIILS